MIVVEIIMGSWCYSGERKCHWSLCTRCHTRAHTPELTLWCVKIVSIPELNLPILKTNEIFVWRVWVCVVGNGYHSAVHRLAAHLCPMQCHMYKHLSCHSYRVRIAYIISLDGHRRCISMAHAVKRILYPFSTLSLALCAHRIEQLWKYGRWMVMSMHTHFPDMKCGNRPPQFTSSTEPTISTSSNTHASIKRMDAIYLE